MKSDLETGSLVGSRYRILETIGRGGFSITYLAYDQAQCEKVVLKELAPNGIVRHSDGTIQLISDKEEADKMIKEFLDEAKRMSRLRVRGVVNVLDAFKENGTAYFSMEYLEEFLPLSTVLNNEKVLPHEKSLKILINTLMILDEIHNRGFLHRDIKPSNMLIDAEDNVILIDFGAAREWHADRTVRHTSLFTAGYAPIEQLAESGKRGPATDIYALCATGWEMLTGAPPPSSIDRVGGKTLPLLSQYREDVPLFLEEALKRGLAIKSQDRPQSASEMLSLLQPPPGYAVVHLSPIDEMDIKLAELQKLKFSPSECPSCNSAIENVKPLKSGHCAVCRKGKILFRNLDERRCAICRSGVLRERENYPTLRYCPICKFGTLIYKGLMSKKVFCKHCNASFIKNGEEMCLKAFGNHESALINLDQWENMDYWLSVSNRSAVVYECETCHAQWDENEDHSWALVYVLDDLFNIQEKHKTLKPEEWARVASGLSIECGNAYCSSCDSDYFIDDEYITLLDTQQDPFDYFQRYAGKKIHFGKLPYLAVGKTSGNPGLVCHECETEFDFDADYLRLRHTEHHQLRIHLHRALPFEDWHRVARGLPTRGEENSFLENFENVLKREVIEGRIPFDDKNEGLLWVSNARRLVIKNEEFYAISKGELEICEGRLSFGGRFRKWQVPLDAIFESHTEENILSLRVAGEQETIYFEVNPVSIEFELRSGRTTLELTAEDLCEIIKNHEFRSSSEHIGR